MPRYEFEGVEKLIPIMSGYGFHLIIAKGGTMDSGMADFSKQSVHIRIVKDRGQWFLEGNKTELEPYGLWKAFDDLDEFIKAVENLIRHKWPI